MLLFKDVSHMGDRAVISGEFPHFRKKWQRMELKKCSVEKSIQQTVQHWWKLSSTQPNWDSVPIRSHFIWVTTNWFWHTLQWQKVAPRLYTWKLLLLHSGRLPRLHRTLQERLFARSASEQSVSLTNKRRQQAVSMLVEPWLFSQVCESLILYDIFPLWFLRSDERIFASELNVCQIAFFSGCSFLVTIGTEYYVKPIFFEVFIFS